MLFALPDPATLYAAFLARDPAWEGRAWVGVTSTGILCRLTCPARKPRPENCRFFDTPAAALSEGFRPCLRCHPLAGAGEADPVVAQLMAALEAEPARRWREADLVALGLDPSTVRRAFRRSLGITFLDIARQRRLALGLEGLAGGDRVIEAQQASGFESASAFRAAVTRLLGAAPGALRGPNDAEGGLPEQGWLQGDWIATPLGPMLAICDATHLHLLEFMDRKGLPAEVQKLVRGAQGHLCLGRTPVTERLRAQMEAFLAGELARFDLPLALHGTPFQREVWQALCEIPAGRTWSYADLARHIGRPSAMRAVARANGANQIAVVIPCHRVIGANGSLTGYAGGLWRKEKLLEVEARYR